MKTIVLFAVIGLAKDKMVLDAIASDQRRELAMERLGTFILCVGVLTVVGMVAAWIQDYQRRNK